MSVQRTGRRRVWALGASVVVAMGLAAGGVSVASAADGSPSSDGPARPALTDTQKSCLESHGVTRPAKPADGSKPTPPTDAQKAAVQAAAQACGVTLPAGGPHPGGPRAGGPGGDRPQLTDAQKSCLESHGVTRPAKPADGSKPTPPTDAQKAAVQAAAQACGITLPSRPATNT